MPGGRRRRPLTSSVPLGAFAPAGTAQEKILERPVARSVHRGPPGRSPPRSRRCRWSSSRVRGEARSRRKRPVAPGDGSGRGSARGAPVGSGARGGGCGAGSKNRNVTEERDRSGFHRQSPNSDTIRLLDESGVGFTSSGRRSLAHRLPASPPRRGRERRSPSARARSPTTKGSPTFATTRVGAAPAIRVRCCMNDSPTKAAPELRRS